MCRFRAIPLLSGLVATGALAAPPDPFEESDDMALYMVEQEVVTVASRYAQTVAEAPSIVTVITDREIRERGLRTVSDVLRGIPGIYVSVSKESRDLAWFRGAIAPDNAKFLLLVDGVPWYDGVYGHAWIDEYLPLDHVRQIEVIKGPGSAIYGTNAFSGVVNVVTYRARDLEGGFVRGVVGSDGRAGVSLVSADRVGKGGRVEVRATARMLGMDGDGLSVTPRDRDNVTGLDPKRSLYGGVGVSAGGLDARVDLVDHRHTYFVNEQDDVLDVLLESPDEFALNYRNVFAAVRYDMELGPSGRLSPHAYTQVHDNPSNYGWLGEPEITADPETGDLSTSWTGGLVEAVKKTTRYGGGVDVELRPAVAHTTIGGVGVEMTRVDALVDRKYLDFSTEPVTPSDFRVDPDRRLVTDAFAFAQHTWTASHWLEATGGARLDQHNFFGTFVSPRAGLLLLPTERARVKVLYGRAFRAPTVRELSVLVGTLSDGSNAYVAGNPNLQPEVIDTVEAELQGEPNDWLSLQAAAFGSRIDREINVSTQERDTLGSHYYANLGSGEVVGLEGRAEVERGVVSGELSGSWTQAIDGESGLTQYGFPALMAHARTTLRVADGLRLSLLADAYGPRPRTGWAPDAGLEDLPGFLLVHGGLATDPMMEGRMRVDLSVRNLLDTAFEEPVYRDDANATSVDDAGNIIARNPRDIEGDGRTIVVGVEVLF